jgi:hypothetical protein
LDDEPATSSSFLISASPSLTPSLLISLITRFLFLYLILILPRTVLHQR